MTPDTITGEDELARALECETFLLFKHSRICPTSAFAFAEYRAFLQEHPDLPSAWVDVVAQRPLSQRVATATGVAHESPQAILLYKGRALWHASHGTITRKSLAQALETVAQERPG